MPLSFSTQRLTVSEFEVFGLRTDQNSLINELVNLLSPRVVEHLPPYFHRIDSDAKAAQWLKRMLQDSRLFPVKDINGDLIGLIFASTGSELETHIGYLLAESSWGQGLASEMLRGFIGAARDSGAWQTLLAGVDQSNAASVRVLESCGFTRFRVDDTGVIFYQYHL